MNNCQELNATEQAREIAGVSNNVNSGSSSSTQASQEFKEESLRQPSTLPTASVAPSATSADNRNFEPTEVPSFTFPSVAPATLTSLPVVTEFESSELQFLRIFRDVTIPPLPDFSVDPTVPPTSTTTLRTLPFVNVNTVREAAQPINLEKIVPTATSDDKKSETPTPASSVPLSVVTLTLTTPLDIDNAAVTTIESVATSEASVQSCPALTNAILDALPFLTVSTVSPIPLNLINHNKNVETNLKHRTTTFTPPSTLTPFPISTALPRRRLPSIISTSSPEDIPIVTATVARPLPVFNYNIELELFRTDIMDRLRLMTQAELHHAFWPYGAATFLSPVLPTPTMPVPYALTSALLPIYPPGLPQPPQQQQQQLQAAHQQASQQQHQLCITSIGSNNSNSLLSSTAMNGHAHNNNNGCGGSSSSNTDVSNKINIQIGLQCMNQNTPMNVTGMNEMNLMHFCGSSEKDTVTSSLRGSQMSLDADDVNTCGIGGGLSGGGGDAIHIPSSSEATVTLSLSKFNELTRLALRGSEIAEKLAYTHRNRPCFKKIDSLCARMKQDLIRPDGVLPNINSQGIAWAVKDFIFVFTRVINAWIIIKGYVYNTPEGLNKVKSALSPDFVQSFAAWQDTTMDFVECLIKSFVNLDNLVQSQKNVYQKSDGGGCVNNVNRATANTAPIKLMQPVVDDTFDFLNNSTEKSQQNSLNKNYLYTMVEDSEGSQRQATVNGTYFKTGTYNPIKKESLLLDPDRSSVTSSSTPSTLTPSQSPPSGILTPPPTALMTTSPPPGILATPSPGIMTTPPPSTGLMTTLPPGLMATPPPSTSLLTTPPPTAIKMKTLLATNVNTSPCSPTVTPSTSPSESSSSSSSSPSTVVVANSHPTLMANNKTLEQYIDEQFSKFWAPQSDDTEMIESPETFDYVKIKEKLPTNWPNYDIRVLEHNLTEFSSVYDPTEPPRPLGKDLIEKLNVMIERVMAMKHADLFFKIQFMKNYFPEFVAKHKNDFMDVRSIILKCQVGGYQDLYEVVHDIRRILYYVKWFLKHNTHSPLQKASMLFENELNDLLNETPFNNYKFDHISGEPNEKLYNCRNRDDEDDDDDDDYDNDNENNNNDDNK